MDFIRTFAQQLLQDKLHESSADDIERYLTSFCRAGNGQSQQ